METVPAGVPLLQLSGVTKRFGGVVALREAQLDLGRGEVLALLGENGAGKSTLLKILAGVQSADSGEVRFNGRELDRRDTPQLRTAAGLVTIHQELSLLPFMSVAENIFLGREPLKWGLIDWRRMRAEAREAMAVLGLDLNPRTSVEKLSVAQQQMVEIARALSQNAQLIVMDEPTAALSGREVDTLHAIVRRLRDRGISVIYVTHRLEEVFAICDRYTVLRDGSYIASGHVADVEKSDIIRLMVGRDVEFERRAGSMRRSMPARMEAQGINCTRRTGDTHKVQLRDLSVRVASGEIVGLAGLIGAGRTELCRAIFGADAVDTGELCFDGEARALPKNPAHAIRQGIVMVPEDRKQSGCFLEHSVRQNLTLACLDRISAWGLVDRSAEDTMVDRYRKALNIKMASPETPIGHLSGGNQQKVILARCLALSPQVLIVDEPTRGIDIGAKAEVHALLGRLADDGMAIIVVSSEMAEVVAISDRIVVFREGRLIGELDAADAEDATLMAMMTGVNSNMLTEAL